MMPCQPERVLECRGFRCSLIRSARQTTTVGSRFRHYDKVWLPRLAFDAKPGKTTAMNSSPATDFGDDETAIRKAGPLLAARVIMDQTTAAARGARCFEARPLVSYETDSVAPRRVSSRLNALGLEREPIQKGVAIGSTAPELCQVFASSRGAVKRKSKGDRRHCMSRSSAVCRRGSSRLTLGARTFLRTSIAYPRENIGPARPHLTGSDLWQSLRAVLSASIANGRLGSSARTKATRRAHLPTPALRHTQTPGAPSF